MKTLLYRTSRKEIEDFGFGIKKVSMKEYVGYFDEDIEDSFNVYQVVVEKIDDLETLMEKFNTKLVISENAFLWYAGIPQLAIEIYDDYRE